MKRYEENHCPLLNNPLEECYVADLHSQNIEKAMYYCWENYERCEIYKRSAEQKTETKQKVWDN